MIKQIEKTNLKKKVRTELEEYINSMTLEVSKKLPREELAE